MDRSWYYGRVFGQFDAGFLGFCEYFREVCGLIEQTEKAIPLWDLSKHSSWVYPYQNIAVISEKPEIISVNSNGKIHSETGPAISYRDGFAVYGLNGIRVPEWVVMTSGTEIDIKKVFALTNVDERRETLRKIPLERLLKETDAKELDRWNDYTLYNLDFKDGKTRVILKMQNPSIDAIHMERVDDKITTCKAALAWRNGIKIYKEPIVLT